MVANAKVALLDKVQTLSDEYMVVAFDLISWLQEGTLDFATILRTRKPVDYDEDSIVYKNMKIREIFGNSSDDVPLEIYRSKESMALSAEEKTRQIRALRGTLPGISLDFVREEDDDFNRTEVLDDILVIKARDFMKSMDDFKIPNLDVDANQESMYGAFPGLNPEFERDEEDRF